MNKNTVIHHSADYDGLFCREIARKFLPDAELIGWDYGDPVPTPDVVSAEDNLYMLDISVEGLMGHPKLIWIDHHKSAMEKYGPLPGYQIDGVAACRLAWQWFSNHWHDPDYDKVPLAEKCCFVDRIVDEPLAVRLAGEYDVWDKRDPYAELFQHGLRSQCLDGVWPILLSTDGDWPSKAVTMLLNAGTGVAYARSQEYREVIQSQGFTVNWEELCFLCCNSHELDIRSQLFEAGIKPEHDALLGFTFTGRDWRVSMYGVPGKPDVDVSVIAKKYGGGGHRGACGFRTKTLPFLT